MPTYEFLCRDCGERYDVRRPMRAASEPAPCPQGHADTVKLLSAIALAGRAGGATPSLAASAPAPSGGGCCGGGCCS